MAGHGELLHAHSGAANNPRSRKTCFFLDSGEYVRLDTASNMVDSGVGSTVSGWSGIDTKANDINGVANWAAATGSFHFFFTDGQVAQFTLDTDKVAGTEVTSSGSKWRVRWIHCNQPGVPYKCPCHRTRGPLKATLRR